MQKTKFFPGVRFLPEQLSEIATTFRSRLPERADAKESLRLNVTLDSEDWSHDHEAEFFSDLRKNPSSYAYRIFSLPYDLDITFGSDGVDAAVCLASRADIEAVFHVVEKLIPAAQLIDDETSENEQDDDEYVPTVFIGHGGSPLWRDLKDHLHDHHYFPVEAYEVGARAGHAIRDILEEMLDSSSIAFLVMTAEDQTADGTQRARQNVVHEIGLFQGRLGFAKAIVLLEEGADEFSNIHGIHQIRFRQGAIRETFGDVLATIHREFPGVAKPRR